MGSIVTCPACNARLQAPTELQPGTDVSCPACAEVFQVPEDRPPANSPPVAAREPKGIVTTPTTPVRDRGQSPEKEDEDHPRPADGHNRLLSNQYEVDFKRWMSIASSHFRGKMLLAPIYVFLGVVVVQILGAGFWWSFLFRSGPGSWFSVAEWLQELAESTPFNGWASLALTRYTIGFFLDGLIDGPVFAGLVLVALRHLKGEPRNFGTFFGGLNPRRYLALVGFSFLRHLAVQLPFLLATLVRGVSFEFGLSRVVPGGELVPFAVGLCLVIFLSVRLTMFGEQLILERHCGVVDAIKGNWEVTRGHFWSLFRVWLVLGLINLGGVLCCGVGFLFSLPFTRLITTAGYLLITNRPPQGGLPGPVSPEVANPSMAEEDYRDRYHHGPAEDENRMRSNEPISG